VDPKREALHVVVAVVVDVAVLVLVDVLVLVLVLVLANPLQHRNRVYCHRLVQSDAP